VSAENTPRTHLPKTVWALGFTSLFMDVSSELIHGLLPVFLVVTLGASAAALGVIEGIAEATAHITRVFSGWLSDTLGRRKALAVAGYGLAAATKPCGSWRWRASSIALAKGFAARRGMRSLPT
jgi:MFS family permease